MAGKTMRGSWLALFALGFAGCADLSTFEHPKVALVDIELRGAKLLAQDFLLTLRIDNPNAYGFKLHGAVAEVFLNGAPVARGLSNRSVTVPAYGHADVVLLATVQTAPLVQELLNLDPKQSIAYRIQGHLSASRGFNWDIRIPFEDSGSLDIGRFLGEPAFDDF